MYKKDQTVFVYGTLKRGGYWHEPYLGRGQSDYLGPVLGPDCVSLYICGLPYLVMERCERNVEGELFSVSTHVLNKIDHLEGHPDFYERISFDVTDMDGNNIMAWGYIHPHDFKGKKKEYTYDV